VEREERVDAEPIAERLLDERALVQLRRVSLAAGRARTEGLAGEHRSRRRGASPEFADFKRYAQGDDFRRIDWNTYARLDGLFVRLSEITTELPVHILLDGSASMDWRGNETGATKFTAGRRLAAALAYVALWSFDRVTIVPFAESAGPAYGPAQGRTHAAPAIRFLERLQPLGGTALAPVIAEYARARSRPGLLLVISDLLSGEPESLREALHDLRGRGWQAVVLHIVDDAEIDANAVTSWLRGSLEGSGGSSLELIDRESGARLRLAADDDVVIRYADAVSAWLEALEAICAAEASSYARISTALGIDTPLLGLLHERGILA
jgi:uncharacterized protein (DUF58 family)